MSAEREQVGELFVAWQTSAYDGQSHAITDEEFAFGKHRDEGHFEAVCGHDMYLADSFKAPGRRCQRCVAFLNARATMRPLHQRLHRRRPIMRLFKAALGCNRSRHSA